MPSSVTVRFHFRSKSTGDHSQEGTEAVLSSSYEVACDGRVVAAGWDPTDHQCVGQMETVLTRFAQGQLTSEDLAWTAPRLRAFLSSDRILAKLVASRERDRLLGIEFSAEEGAARLLTNIPWEVTALLADELSREPASLLQQLVASFPVARIVPGGKAVTIPDSQLRALYCISNPKNNDVPPFDAASFKSTMQLVFHQFPMIDVRASQVDADNPSSGVALAEIRNFRPHVFVFVGHGDTGNRGQKNPALCFERWVDTGELAECLLSTKRAFLAVLICCDMTRDNGAQSGARILTARGVPHVLAMQGNILASFARMYLNHFLSNLLVGYSVSLAGSSSRIASGRDGFALLQSFLPTVFHSEGSPSDLFEKTIGRYRIETQKLALRVRPLRTYFQRPKLEGVLRDALKKHGLVRILGGLGCGKTSLLARVIHDRLADKSEPPERPIFYLTCDTQEYSTGRFKDVAEGIRALVKRHEILLPEDRLLDEPGPEGFCASLDRRRLILVLDNLTLPFGTNASPEWNLFLRATAAMDKSLLVLAEAGSESNRLEEGATITVDPFSPDETQAFVRRFMPGRLAAWRKIYADTGGVALLLEALRAHEQESSLSEVPQLRSKNPSRSVADRYVKKVLQLLLPNEAQTLCNFTWLPRPTTKSLADRFLDSTKNRRGLAVLKRVGVLRSATLEGTVLYDIPGTVADGLFRICGPRIERGAKILTERFEQELPKGDENIARYVKALTERPGGMALLGCMQRAYISTQRLDRAAAISVLASEARTASDLRWELYEAVLPEMRKSRDVPFLLSAADLALGMGLPERAKEISDWIPVKELTPYYHVVYLNLRAGVLKDMEQHAALPEIRAIYEEAIPLCERGYSGAIRDPDASEPDWKSLLCDLLENRLAALAFLDREPPESLAGDLARLKTLHGETSAFAYALCLVVERQLRESDTEIDWGLVTEHLFSARKVMEGSQNFRLWSQWELLYGEYLCRKPRPENKEAIKAFHRSEDVAERAGEKRRAARARRKWVELEWRVEKSLTPDRACELLEEVIPNVERQSRDSFSSRILERIYTLRAEIGLSLPQDPTQRFLRKACEVAARPMLSGASDRERLARSLLRYLDLMEAQQNFAGAQEFISEFSKTLKTTLKIDPVVDDPWGVRVRLLENCRNYGEKGKWV
jgi:hypothetical protein